MDIIRKVVFTLLFALPVLCFSANPVDINAADLDTLMTIKGVGEKRAAAIIEYRNKNGKFRSVDELSDVQGVSETLVEKNRDILSVSSK